MKNPRFVLFLIFILTFISVIIDLPDLSVNIRGKDYRFGNYNIDTQVFGKRIFRDLSLRRGLDLSGGAHIVLEADMSKIAEEEKKSAHESSSEVIRRRVDFLGVSEPNIQTSKVGESYRIIVELPGIEDTQAAVSIIGQTAHLDFRKLLDSVEYDREKFREVVLNPRNWEQTDLSGADIVGADIVFGGSNIGDTTPQIRIKFSFEGRKKFSELAKANVGKPLGIFLDGLPISMPEVGPSLAEGITSDPVITGNFTPEIANNLAIQIRAGALPVPIEIIEQRNIGATLGEESIQKSVRAGGIGLLAVLVFMVVVYRKLGLLAGLALIVYGLITLALYKLIPVTLTLAGISGFLLSVGMAVDSNILIFERIKEELRTGTPREIARELGFGRAWDSIRDANVATLITCFILFNPFQWSFLNTSGVVRGFALTLALGIFVSLFTGIVVTRTLVRVFYK